MLLFMLDGPGIFMLLQATMRPSFEHSGGCDNRMIIKEFAAGHGVVISAQSPRVRTAVESVEME